MDVSSYEKDEILTALIEVLDECSEATLDDLRGKLSEVKAAIDEMESKRRETRDKISRISGLADLLDVKDPHCLLLAQVLKDWVLRLNIKLAKERTNELYELKTELRSEIDRMVSVRSTANFVLSSMRGSLNG